MFKPRSPDSIRGFDMKRNFTLIKSTIIGFFSSGFFIHDIYIAVLAFSVPRNSTNKSRRVLD